MQELSIEKVDFVVFFVRILRYSPHKTELDNLSPVIRARYVIDILFEGFFGAVFRATL